MMVRYNVPLANFDDDTSRMMHVALDLIRHSHKLDLISHIDANGHIILTNSPFTRRRVLIIWALNQHYDEVQVFYEVFSSLRSHPSSLIRALRPNDITLPCHWSVR